MSVLDQTQSEAIAIVKDKLDLINSIVLEIRSILFDLHQEKQERLDHFE